MHREPDGAVLHCRVAWTAARVRRLILDETYPAIARAMEPSAVTVVAEDGSLQGGLNLIHLAELALGRNTELYRNFAAHLWASLVDPSEYKRRGWPPVSDDALVTEAHDRIAAYLDAHNFRIVPGKLDRPPSAVSGMTSPIQGEELELLAIA